MAGVGNIRQTADLAELPHPSDLVTGGTWAGPRGSSEGFSPVGSPKIETPKSYNTNRCLYITHHEDSLRSRSSTKNIIPSNLLQVIVKKEMITKEEIEAATSHWKKDERVVVFLELNLGNPGRGLTINNDLIDFLLEKFSIIHLRLFSLGSEIGKNTEAKTYTIDITSLKLELYGNKVSVGKSAEGIPGEFLAPSNKSPTRSVRSQGSSGTPTTAFIASTSLPVSPSAFPLSDARRSSVDVTAAQEANRKAGAEVTLPGAVPDEVTLASTGVNPNPSNDGRIHVTTRLPRLASSETPVTSEPRTWTAAICAFLSCHIGSARTAQVHPAPTDQAQNEASQKYLESTVNPLT